MERVPRGIVPLRVPRSGLVSSWAVLVVAACDALFVVACVSEKTFENVADGAAAGDADGGGESDGDAGECAEPCVEIGAWTCTEAGARLCELGPSGECARLAEAVSCEDDNACTEDLCAAGVGCTHGPKSCDDGDVCNGVEGCDAAAGCQPGTPLACDDVLVCTGVETCDPKLGCLQGTPPPGCCKSDDHCNDGNLCNGVGQCELATGTCLLTPALSCDDGEPCNGLESCNPVEGCLAGAALPCSDGNVCNGVEACETGKGCQPGQVLSCNDGLPCNGQEVCDPETGCLAGLPLQGCCKSKAQCEDGNPCNGNGDCDLASETCSVAPPEKCDDGNPCNGAESCDKALGCQPGPPLACGDGNPCNGVESCDPETGCAPGQPFPCGNANACDGLEACDPEKGCVPGEPPKCNDGNPCTGVESCDKDLGCVSGAPLDCSDDNLCDGAESCDEVKGCVEGEPPDCTDDDPCTDDKCDPASGCVKPPAPDGKPCEDGDACTKGDSCKGGGCAPGKSSCDDGNACTKDACAGEAGCTNTPISCSDGDACTGDGCDPETGCKFAPKDCSDGDACTEDDCEPAAGCTHDVVECGDGDACADVACAKETGCSNEAASCDDGDLCTGEGCDPASGCTFEAADCDDGDACTVDGCDPAEGCTHDADPCSDGDACTDDGCGPGSGCTHTPILVAEACDDGKACTEESCDPVLGCKNASAACADGDPCTEDLCDDAGGCSNPPADCADELVCTDDFCQPGAGCKHVNADCDDGLVCTEDVCDSGTGCQSFPLDCTDGDPCTDDLCDDAEGCSNPPADCADEFLCTDDFCVPGEGCKHVNADCDDGDACTEDVCSGETGCASFPLDCGDGEPCTDDVCEDGAGCLHPAADCDDSDACTGDACDPVLGCTHLAAGCDDGDACTEDACDALSGCSHPALDCGEGEPCTAESCVPGEGCVTTFPTSPCDDGNPCTGPDACEDGTCAAPAGSDAAFGGAQNDQARALVAVPGGGFAIAGFTESKGAGGRDAWLARTDAAGALVWDRTFGGAGFDEAHGLASLEDGGFAMAGSTTSEGAGSDDMLLVRTDEDGDAVFSETYGGTGSELARALVTLPGGGFALAGFTTSGGTLDVRLVVTDAGGGEEWSQTYGGAGEQNGVGLVVLPDGGFAVLAITGSKGAGKNDFWLLRTDADGDALWDRTFGGAQDEEPFAIAALPNGGFALAGTTASKGAGGADAWLVRTDAFGEAVSDHTYGGGGQDFARTVIPLADGGFAMGGGTTSKGAGAHDFWLVRTSADGALRWERTYGGTKEDDSYGLAALPDGGFALAGATQSKGSGSHDLWLVLPSDGVACPDGDPCDGALQCLAGSCSVSVPISCDDANDCTTDACQPGSGCTHTPVQIGADCDDGNPCTAGGKCAGTACDPLGPTSCDDGDPCTDDLCDSVAGCTATPNAAPCDDGDPCTVSDACDGGACEGGPAAFDARFGGGDDDEAHAVASLPGGGFAMAGRTKSKGAGGGDLWLVRTDASGDLLWDETFGGPLYENGYALAALPDGGFAVAGQTTSKGAGSGDMWLVRTEASGELLFDRTFGGGSNDGARGLALLPGGEFALAGYTTSKGAGSEDMWLVRTEADGDPLWDETFGGGGDEQAFAVAALPDGGFALAGYTTSKGAGSYDTWLVRTDVDGELLWEKTFGGGNDDVAHALASVPVGGFALAGHTASKGAGSFDMWLLRTDAAGEPLWDQTFGGGGDDQSYALASLSDGGFALVGYTDAKGAGGDDLWLVRTDASGELLWDRTFGGGSDDVGSALGSLSEGGFAVAGHTFSNSAGSNDMWLVVSSDAAPCDDDEPCDGLLECFVGTCSVSAPFECDDGDSCTADACLPGDGCVSVPFDDGEACEDGNLCTAGDACTGGSCVPGAAVPCDDGNDCTDDACDPSTGCTHEPSGGAPPCDDGSPCTLSDACAGGECAGGFATFDAIFGGAGSTEDNLGSVSLVDDGGFALAGYTYLDTAGLHDMWLVRTDADGVPLWDERYGGADVDRAKAVAPLPDGGFALAGWTQSKGSGSFDMWLVRTDAEGQLLWDEVFGGESSDEAYAMSVLPEGGFALAGSTSSSGAGGLDMWLVLADADGGLVGEATFGGAATDEATALAGPLVDGGFALAGYTASKGLGGDDMWLVRTDAGGDLLWDRTFGGTGKEWAYAVSALADGGFALAGFTNSQGAGAADFWLVRTDEEGDLLWDETFGGPLSDAGTGMSVVPGGFALAGYTDSKGAGERDAWLVRVDAEGGLLWDWTFGGTSFEEVLGITALPGGGFALAGFTNPAGTPSYDGWLVVTTDGAPCDDGEACDDHVECFVGTCAVPVPLDCDDGEPCTDDACNPSTGCTHLPSAGSPPCDDGDPCTLESACVGGECLGGPDTFDVTFGGGILDEARAVAVLPDGGFALAGFTESKGAGKYDMWLVRTDASGELVWDQTYGGVNYEEALALASLPDGGFALAGHTSSATVSADMRLVRTDAEGALLWQQTYGGADVDLAYAVASLPDGGFAVAGCTGIKAGVESQMRLVRTDAEGDPVWDRTYGGGKVEVATAVASLPDGGFALAGYTNSEGAGSYDAWLVRTDGSGELLWDRTFGGGASDSAYALASLPDGGFALAGTLGTGGGDAWLVRTDGSGELLWETAFDGGSGENAVALAFLPDGGFALAGDTYSVGAGSYDLWLVRTDGAGQLLWDRNFGGGSRQYNLGLASLPGGGFAVAGRTAAKGAGSNDMWLVVTTDGAPCDDDEPCDGLLECLEGTCSVSAPLDCDDGDPGTLDACVPGVGCTHASGGPCGLLGEACPNGFTCSASQSEKNPDWDYCVASDPFAGEAVFVPEGVFWMGCDATTPQDVCGSAGAEGPSHAVDVPAFVLQRTEVTTAQWEACHAAGGCEDPAIEGSQCTFDNALDEPKPGKEDHAVACMVWAQAEAYCAWLASETGDAWRLPSESEWEKAARGSCAAWGAPDDATCKASMPVYPWGNETATCEFAVMKDVTDGCGTGGSLPAGSRPDGASVYGALDLSGSVAEYVGDVYHPNYSGAPADGSTWLVPGGPFRVLKDFHFGTSNASLLRSAARGSGDPASAFAVFGFRCARALRCDELPADHCDDENACTTDTCVDDPAGATCEYEVVDCDDGDPCTVNGCDAETGCTFEGECCGLLGEHCPAGFTCATSGSAANPTWDYCVREEGAADEEVYVPGGATWMGCDAKTPQDTSCQSDESPSHLVTVPAFVIQRTEVTASAWAACQSDGGCEDPAGQCACCTFDPATDQPVSGKAEHPLNCASWDQVDAYCAWLAAETGRPWRLPSESEWEKSARGGCATWGAPATSACGAAVPVYPWGNATATCTYAVMDGGGGAGCGTGIAPLAVGSKPSGASVYGALDLSGNLQEWVEDYLHSTYTGAPADGSPWLDPTATARVVRNGTYAHVAPLLRAANRSGLLQTSGNGSVGFRCARSVLCPDDGVPGAAEACNGKDDDCDGEIDEDVAPAACDDGDAGTVDACARGAGCVHAPAE